MPRAARVADLLREKLNIETELVPGGRGVFEVRVDGQVVAVKSAGEFPTPELCLEAVRAAL